VTGPDAIGLGTNEDRDAETRMTPERELEHKPLVLDQAARGRYYADGFLTVPEKPNIRLAAPVAR
jgi:hypothetical protein